METYKYSKARFANRLSDTAEKIIEFVIGFVLPVIFLIVLPIVALFAINYSYMTYTCNQYGENTEKETKYNLSGCYIKDNGVWYNWEEYKHRFVAQGKMR